jgi:hypothetical protein
MSYYAYARLNLAGGGSNLPLVQRFEGGKIMIDETSQRAGELFQSGYY